jgi:hypothetical protein
MPYEYVEIVDYIAIKFFGFTICCFNFAPNQKEADKMPVNCVLKTKCNFGYTCKNY